MGGALLEQIAGQLQRLARDFKLDLRVRAIAGSKTMRLAAGSIDAERVGGVLVDHLGADDARLDRLRRAAEAAPC